MRNDSKNCPYCGSIHVHKTPKKMIGDKKKFISFNLVWFPMMIFLFCKDGGGEKLLPAILGSLIGEFLIIFLSY
jgi:hypothetical protein